jgi:hypothetical protein
MKERTEGWLVARRSYVLRVCICHAWKKAGHD